MTQPVAVIGLDGAAPRFVFDEWRNELPTLSRLMARGVWGRLRSIHPPITVPAWASMFSGKDAGQLGLYGFRNRRSYAYDDLGFATSAAIKHELLWDAASRAGKRVIVLGVPPGYPPRPVNGCAVSCFMTPSSQRCYTHPPELQAEVEEAAAGYVFDVEDFRTDDKHSLLRRVYSKTRKHFAVARHLVKTKPWDLFAMVEMGVDRIHHGFWKFCDPQQPGFVPGHPLESAVRDYYRYLDGELEELIDAFPRDTIVLVVSDHGARALEGSFCFNEWLRRRGYLRLLAEPPTPSILRPEMIDWSATRAWGEGGYYGRLCLNVHGREPLGVVEPGDVERVLNDLVAEIEAIEHPKGGSLGSRALRPEELFAETHGVPPDLMVYFGDLRWRSAGTVGTADVYSTTCDIGPDHANHDWDGILILGDGRAEGTRVEGLTIADVAPALRRRMGLEVPGGGEMPNAAGALDA